ncbi:hypothetical protein L6452_22647 [Arctium lappa]|uniref:Uncharacterized protein n=1 Tax=Arctium lappa TaxID=4217 RepID=A0ACB9B1N5_ARCLA|nr:hypothetical protein L6452_22647 [Arctium lappa]
MVKLLGIGSWAQIGGKFMSLKPGKSSLVELLMFFIKRRVGQDLKRQRQRRKLPPRRKNRDHLVSAILDRR